MGDLFLQIIDGYSKKVSCVLMCFARCIKLCWHYFWHLNFCSKAHVFIGARERDTDEADKCTFTVRQEVFTLPSNMIMAQDFKCHRDPSHAHVLDLYVVVFYCLFCWAHRHACRVRYLKILCVCGLYHRQVLGLYLGHIQSSEESPSGELCQGHLIKFNNGKDV